MKLGNILCPKYEKSVFSWYVWNSTTPSEVHKPFYFIPNEKYGHFLKFWASKLQTTKTRVSVSIWNLKLNQMCPNWVFFANFARSYRTMKLGWGAKCQERSILFIWNKIKMLMDSWSGRGMPNISWKNWFLIGIEGFRVSSTAKFDQKHFVAHM